jgi:hypothetical protein
MNPASSTPYEFVGELPALGSLQLTQLARSYEEVESTSLDPFFPAQSIDARTIVIETIKEGLGIAPLVQFGKPAGAFMDNERIERRIIEPAVTREDDFLDQGLINQLRKPGTFNEAWAPQQLMEHRVRKLVVRQKRTISLLQAYVLQGGIDHLEPRTNVRTVVSTQIPAHNFFRYDGFGATLAAAAPITGTPYTAAKALSNNKGRPEALMFVDTATNTAGVPWTHPYADILRCLRYLKQYAMNTNKNRYTDLVMSRDLYTVIQENHHIKASMGQVGIFMNSVGLATGSANASTPPALYQFSSDGELKAMAGLNIILVDTMFRDPEDDEVKKMWPSNLVAIVARNHYSDRQQTLGYTQYCVGEAPDGKPGMWMRSGPDQMPPAPPGRTMQIGNAFLPYAMYPQWIMLLTVAEEEDVDANVYLRADLSYGTF